MTNPGVMAVSWAAWSWFLVLVSSLLRAAMWRAPARMARAGASGRCHGSKGRRWTNWARSATSTASGLGAGLHGLSEAFGGLGVDHHDIQPGVIQGDRQVEVVEAWGPPGRRG